MAKKEKERQEMAEFRIKGRHGERCKRNKVRWVQCCSSEGKWGQIISLAIQQAEETRRVPLGKWW